MQRCLFVRRIHATDTNPSPIHATGRGGSNARAPPRPMRPAALIRARGNVVTALARVREERAGRGRVRAR